MPNSIINNSRIILSELNISNVSSKKVLIVKRVDRIPFAIYNAARGCYI